ncbi:transmembrane O-methyltransferase homolog [Amblyraja radiata]|uniref:transmembrane O-methyltransferase homolog n=1 Tax=Amblyraja radiata TaxID=386614 RepID=UPI0014034C49|nr:transmembrane O-methyltransferase homolog [Amblyraja radiata]
MQLAVLAALLLPVCAALAHRYRRLICGFYRRRLLPWLGGPSPEERILRHVRTEARHGTPDRVLSAIEEWCRRVHPVTDTDPGKARFLDGVVLRTAPLHALLVGAHCGYSAIRLARLLAPGAILVAVEPDPRAAEIVEEMILLGGINHSQFRVLSGSPAEAIAHCRSALEVSSVQLAVLTQGRGCDCVRDLRSLEQASLLAAGSLVLADCLTSSGASCFLASIRPGPLYTVSSQRRLDGIATDRMVELTVNCPAQELL